MNDALLNGIVDQPGLVLDPDQLTAILEHVKTRFPLVSRITCYARSDTVTHVGETALKRLAAAGLNRIHIGMESGSDRVLKRIRKGETKQDHIDAGQMVKHAGIELSEYVMPGLGGAELSEEHAMETADALNRIDANFIRLRSLSIQHNTPLYEQYQAGTFIKNSEIQTIAEIRRLIKNLEDVSSTVMSDHIYNLLYDINGTLPQDKEKILDIIDGFLELQESDQLLFLFGRRMGYFRDLRDLQSTARRSYVTQISHKFNLTPSTIDRILEQNSPTYI